MKIPSHGTKIIRYIYASLKAAACRYTVSTRAQSSFPQATHIVSLVVSAQSLGSSDHNLTVEFPHRSLIEWPTLPPGCEKNRRSSSLVVCTFSGQSTPSIQFSDFTFLLDGASSTQPVPAVEAVRLDGENCTPKAESTSTLVSYAIRSTAEQPSEYDDATQSKKYAIIGVSFAVAALILIAGCVVLRRNMTRASTVGLSRMGSLRSVNKCGILSGQTGRSSTSGEYDGPDAYKHYREKSLRRQEAVRAFQNMVAEKAAAAAAGSSAGPSTAHCSLNREDGQGEELSVDAGPRQGDVENDAYDEKDTCVVDLSQLTSPASRQGTSRESSLHAIKIPSAYLFDDGLDPGEYFKMQADKFDNEIRGAATSIDERLDYAKKRPVVLAKTPQPSSPRSAAGSPPPPPPSSLGRRRSTRYPWASSVHRPVSISSSRSAVAAAVRVELRKAVSAEGLRVDRASMCRRCSVLSQRPRRLSARYPHRISGHHPLPQQHHQQLHHLHHQQQLQPLEEQQRPSRGFMSEPIDVYASPQPSTPPPRPMSPQTARLGCRTKQGYQRTNQHVIWVGERRGSHGLYGYI